MDFYRPTVRETKEGLELYPDFIVGRSKDLMVRAKSFYAVWDEANHLWSTDEYDVQRLVDEELDRYAAEAKAKDGTVYKIKHLRNFSSQGWSQFRKYLQNISDNSHQLDETLVFANQDVKKSDYASRRLPYPLAAGDYSAWDEMIGVLYAPEEREKIEWSIGAVVSGDAKKIQKFLVLYGPAGTGKSTVLNVVQKLFEGYTTSFEAKALGMNNNAFATEAFKGNPLVAIQHDGDLSKIEDNTKLNSIISHEEMTMNEKFKPSYTSRVNAFLFMGTNQPVKISDAKSGIIRRLIDVHPTGVKLAANHYSTLMARIDFELGAIAHHCLDVYRNLGKNYYNAYRPTEMMLQTDVFFNFIEATYDVFKYQDNTTLKQAYTLYKEFCADTGIERPMPQYKLREELRNYFEEFHDRKTIDGVDVRSYYSGFNATKFKTPISNDKTAFSLVLEDEESLLDELLKDQPAQYATDLGVPKKRWANVSTTLADIETKKLHYVKVPETHIVIDFDLKDDDGNKSLERNLEAASQWPATYGELSKSGSGVHLHYNYTGPEPERLATDYADGIEVKHYGGDSALRRLLSKCNAVPVADLNSGLPLKEEKKVQTADTIQSEKGLRELIARNLRKEIHPGTKSSVDFIHKILEDAHKSGMQYDVTDMRGAIFAFANNSSNQSLQALKLVQSMKFASEGTSVNPHPEPEPTEPTLVFFDVEVYPNLFVVCWKYDGSDTVVKMINPKPQEIEELFKLRLVGFNNRRYDNHILYARYMGYDNAALYKLSSKMINDTGNAGTFGEAYNISYTDIYDFSSKKQGLKKFMIELGIHHMEMDIPWDQDAPPEMWEKIVEYCANDVEATEAVFHARAADFTARQILAELSGLSVNDSTNKHTAKIIFNGDRDAQKRFDYTDLAELFPGYSFDMGKSQYRGEDPGEGGYVYAEPGMYENVALLDVASMHPTSIINLNLFGPYTPRFGDLLNARLAIKAGKYDEARTMLDGRLKPYLTDEKAAKDLSYALKIVINIVYGMTSAKFDNPFRDNRNIDNIVAKRGALFMIDLKHAVQEQGFTVAHIKTDSIKIPNATPEIIQFVFDFGKKYGYDFEHEATYEKFCLVNDAVYVAKDGDHWSATGAQFQHPYVFKTLFTDEEITFEDLAETKQVSKGAIYLDFHHEAPAFLQHEAHFVGRIGRFVPVARESGIGGVLYRVHEGKQYAVAGTKGYYWAEAAIARDEQLEQFEVIEMDYYEGLLGEAIDTIKKFGDVEQFIGEKH
jgi:hypothetical protein